MRTSGLISLTLAAAGLLLSGCAAGTTGTSGTTPPAAPTATPSQSASDSPSPTPSAPLTAKEPSPPKATATREPGPSGKTVRGIVSAGGAAKGPLDKVSTALTDDAAVQAYASRLAPSLRKQFLAEAQRLLKTVPEGQYLHAQTVYDGCETPNPATITAKLTSAGIALTVKKPLDTTKQCFTAERSVAFLSVSKMAG